VKSLVVAGVHVEANSTALVVGGCRLTEELKVATRVGGVDQHHPGGLLRPSCGVGLDDERADRVPHQDPRRGDASVVQQCLQLGRGPAWRMRLDSERGREMIAGAQRRPAVRDE
jgi:hypothetical protein